MVGISVLLLVVGARVEKNRWRQGTPQGNFLSIRPEKSRASDKLREVCCAMEALGR